MDHSLVSAAVDSKAVWEKPAVASVTPITDAEGNAGGGPDFGSELGDPS